ncbi:hypothetical protein LMH73_017845 [Vibrio splendidus]|nr:hypothetical protein [Vibrio splendidus]MCC4881546.1 hypothetical protein [Vibrio splendidus]
MKIITKRQLALFHSAVTDYMLARGLRKDNNPLDFARSIESKTLYDVFCSDPSESSIYHRYLTILCETEDVAFAMGDPDGFTRTYNDDVASICDIIRSKTQEYGEIYVSIALEQESINDVIYFFVGNETKQ